MPCPSGFHPSRAAGAAEAEVVSEPTQRTQYPLIKEHELDDMVLNIMVEGIFLN